MSRRGHDAPDAGAGAPAAVVPEVRFAALSDAGTTHPDNADAVRHWRMPDGLVFAVADGIGAGATGAVASALALERIAACLAETAPDVPVPARLRRAVQDANVAVYHKALTVPDLSDMATTLTVSAVVGASLVAAHVGDCRLWLLRDGALIQLTKDHTWAWAHLPGVDVRETTHGRPRRYSLPRCLGRELVVSIDLLSLQLHAGDVLVQTSDGIHGVLGADELCELVQAHPPDAACRALVRRTREEDATDDASVQIAAIVRVAGVAPRSWWPFAR